MADRHFTVVEFGRRCRRKRLQYDLRQREVAARIGMGTVQYSQLERGVHPRMQLTQLAKLADVLGCSVDYLLQRTDDEGTVPPRRSPAEGEALAA